MSPPHPSREGGAHPVEDVSPSLHGDALEDGEHGEEEVVKVGDAPIGALPATPALRVVLQAGAAVPRKSTRGGVVL